MNITTDMVLVQVEQSIWTGKAKLRREDIPDADKLPPDVLVSLGSKKIFNPDLLKPFLALRQETSRLLWSYGVKFLSGYVIPADKMQELDSKLVALRAKYTSAFNHFVQTYEQEVDAWCSQFSKWEPILRRAVPSLGEVGRRFSYEWYMYSITVPDTQLSGAASARSLIADIPDRVLDEVVQAISSSKSSSSLMRVVDKMRSMSFSDPRLAALANILDDVSGLDETVQKWVLDIFSDRGALAAALAAAPKVGAMPVDDMLAACSVMLAAPEAKADPQPDVPVAPSVEPEPAHPVLPVLPEFDSDISQFIMADTPEPMQEAVPTFDMLDNTVSKAQTEPTKPDVMDSMGLW